MSVQDHPGETGLPLTSTDVTRTHLLVFAALLVLGLVAPFVLSVKPA